MPVTSILEPLPDDDVDKSSHSANFLRIKSFLATFKPEAENITIDDFLSRLNLTLNTYILAIRSSLKTATVFIQRLPGDVRVNNYNVDCLKAWRANMDIQFVLNVYACASYITSYVAKSERGMSDLLQKACEEAKHGNSNLKQQVRLIGNKFLNNVEMSAQEAVYLLLQLPLKRSSRQVIFINTSPPEERVYLIKSNIDLLPDDAEIAQSNLISRYVTRNSQLEEVCLADYAALYNENVTTSDLTNSDDECENENNSDIPASNLPKRRNTARVIRTVNFSRLRDPEKWAREKLMLYTHWRNEETELYGGYQTYIQHYDAVKDRLSNLMKTYESYADDVTTAVDTMASADPQQQWDLLAPGLLHSDTTDASAGVLESAAHAAINPDSHGQNQDYDLALDLGLGHVTSFDTAGQRFDMSDDEYFSLMQSLNCQQMEFVSDTLHHLKVSQEPTYRFLSGGAGTGKSYVLKAIRESAERYFRTRAGIDFTQHWTVTLAPTGKAAFLAGGATIHSVLHIPANQSLTYRRLDNESLNTLRAQISHIKLWLIDEISMVGHRLFSFIDQRLQEVNNTSRPFGGSSVIAFGDFFQLPPVMDGFIFEDFSSSRFNTNDYNALAPNLWSQLFRMFELTQIMRQQDCLPFAELLNRLREGNHTSDDLKALATRIISPDIPNYPRSALHLFKTNMQVDQYNNSVFQTSVGHKLTIHAVDSVVGSVSEDIAERILSLIPHDTRKTAQLSDKLSLAVGCRYEISVNVNVPDGLANGAGGILKLIQLTSSDLSASGTVWIQFDDSRVGAQARADARALYQPGIDAVWTPIQPLIRQFQVGRNHSSQVMRKQFPLRQSSAKTVHRCQGDTLDQVVVDFTTSRKEAHSHYVGLSRVTTIDGLFILNLCPDKIAVSEQVKLHMSKLRTDSALPLSLYLPYAVNAGNCYQISFLNARSLHKHIDCVRKDRALLACDVILFCETRSSASDSHDFYTLADFKNCHYPDQSERSYRSHYGLALYSKLDILFVNQPVTLHDSRGSIESITTVFAVHSKLVIALACVYRRPNTDLIDFQAGLSLVLEDLDRIRSDDSDVHVHRIITGDFNLDWSDDRTKSRMSTLLPGYRQLVHEVTTDYGSTLDHIYTDLPDDTIQCYVTESYYTDHKPLFLYIGI